MIANYFARLSTGVKMLLILSTALLPLGLIALLASIESAQSNRLQRESEARLMASASARQIEVAITRLSTGLRQAATGPLAFENVCRFRLERVRQVEQGTVHLGLFDSAGRHYCVTPDMIAVPVNPPGGQIGTELRLLVRQQALRLVVGTEGDAVFGVGEITRDGLARLARPASGDGPYSITLTQGTARLPLIEEQSNAPLGQHLAVSVPVAGGQLALETSVTATPITATEILMVLLPVMMWLSAAMIGWLVVDRLLLRPLAQMQSAVISFRPGDGPLSLPRLTTPSMELRGLGDAFVKVTADLANHEVELEQGLARQTRLTREVHHRVKNNLQVVSSLINLHARGATDEGAADAYASIQRRVDALAVVHRNHYAELEENKGVGVRALVGELASNLRATAPAHAAHMAITLNMIPAFVSQDVAVPVAFLITEIAELIMDCDPEGTIAIVLAHTDTPHRALLSITASGLRGERCRSHPALERFTRILQGLSRQLRAPLAQDETIGCYSIEISVVPGSA